jgi:hypothetical protein
MRTPIGGTRFQPSWASSTHLVRCSRRSGLHDGKVCKISIEMHGQRVCPSCQNGLKIRLTWRLEATEVPPA